MMQTFLPYSSFRESARCLDAKRLGKQRVEAKQILIALGYGVGDHEGNARSRWRSHPAVRMWKRGELWLAEYAMEVCREWQSRGYRDTLFPQFQVLWTRLLSCPERSQLTRPEWIGMDSLHASHRSNLLRKLPSHYSRFGWAEADDMEYVWPV
jgi:hypothetical protein